MSSSVLNDYGNLTWLALKKNEGTAVIRIAHGLLTIAMGKQSLNVAEKPS